jgi:hypothetical protein
MKQAQSEITTRTRKPQTALPSLLRQEAAARYLRGRILAHPDLVLKCKRAAAPGRPADFRTTPLLLSE